MTFYEKKDGGLVLSLDVAERITVRSALRVYLHVIKERNLKAPLGRIRQLLEIVTPKGFEDKGGDGQ